MKVTSIKATNFASYKEIVFEPQDNGLCLISGPTGSGKSTLCDLAPWCLFGRTAKDGAVDEIRSWNTDEPTVGTIVIEINGHMLTVTRSRTPNDLYYTPSIPGAGPETRGKDLNDTQKLINNLLGFNVDTYLNGAYYHEFCQSAQFFITSAKNRRAITEQLVDLSLATDLNHKAKINIKDLKAAISETTTQLNSAKTNVHTLSTTVNNAKRLAFKWELDIAARAEDLYAREAVFEQERKIRLSELVLLSDELEYDNNQAQESVKTGICPTCGNQYTKTHAPHKKPNPYIKMIDKLLAEVNTYGGQARALAKDKNPHTSDDSDKIALSEAQDKLTLYTETLRELTKEMSDLELLGDVLNDFRGVLVKNAVIALETETNSLLTTHFDAEIRVDFSVADADKLDVTIHKDGNECTYTQLSKGQRQLLKLCFSISVMKAVSNQQGVHFDQIFFDEALSGLDERFKNKAFNMFESLALSHSSVMIIDHSLEFKSLFNSRIEVSLNGGNSTIEES